jgi:hypothetical protein
MNTQNYGELVGQDMVDKAVKALADHNFMPESVATGADAFARIKELIPAEASVMNGASKTLDEIGFTDYLKGGEHGWNNLHASVLAETDPAKQAELRKHAVVSDWYLGSAHAVTAEGEMLIASNTGSQLPHLAYTSPNIILVVSTKKIVPTLADAFDRLNTFVLPLEDARIQQVYGVHTTHAKTLILHKEGARSTRKIHILFVNEKLGF